MSNLKKNQRVIWRETRQAGTPERLRKGVAPLAASGDTFVKTNDGWHPLRWNALYSPDAARGISGSEQYV